jgi:hypothetical protein
LWHLSDLPTLLTNVGNQGKSGNDSDIVKVSRMTQMRNSQSYVVFKPMVIAVLV